MNVNYKILGIPLGKEANAQGNRELPSGATIKQLIEVLAADINLSYDEAIRATSFMVNNRKADLDTLLCEEDQVLVMRMLGGG